MASVMASGHTRAKDEKLQRLILSMFDSVKWIHAIDANEVIIRRNVVEDINDPYVKAFVLARVHFAEQENKYRIDRKQEMCLVQLVQHLLEIDDNLDAWAEILHENAILTIRSMDTRAHSKN
jgi:hypothetical protein